MANLGQLNLIKPLTHMVIYQKLPFLGICLGMHMLAKCSSEMGTHAGLGWINAEVEYIRTPPGVRVPHVAWNSLNNQRKSTLFNRLAPQDHFYFDHSYQFVTRSDNILAYTNYHGQIPAIISRDNITATQFHPEKSQRAGLILLRNFLNTIPHNSPHSV